MEKRRRGRPKGTTKEVMKRRGPIARKWEPLSWKPIHDKIVILAAYGVKRSEIAEKLDCSAQLVTNILNSQKGSNRLSELLKRIREKSEVDITEKLKFINKRSLERIEQTIDNDHIFNREPIKVAHLATKLLEGSSIIGKKEPVSNNNINNNQKTVTINQFNVLKEGLDRSNEVNQIYGKGVPLQVDGNVTPFPKKKSLDKKAS